MQEYAVICATCNNPFNAMESAWCSCVVASRSLVCPHCLRCFCKAPRSYKQAFWSAAPPDLWKRRMANLSEEATPIERPRSGNDLHPLVLVVEDDPEVRRMAVMAVERLGYNVIMGRNGLEGLELAKSYKPELIITDALMPRMDGREMARRLKDDPETRNIRVAVMTSIYTAAKYRVEALKVFHVDDYLLKPLELSELQALLTRHIG